MIRIFAVLLLLLPNLQYSLGQDTLVSQAADTVATKVDTMATTLPSTSFDEPPGPDHPPLSAIQLQREKWYYSMDEAMREPDKVVKLSLKDQGFKYFPTEITYFRNLQILNLSGNKIKEIPGSIGDLTNLTVLILTDNKIRLLSDDMAKLDNLTQLYLASNKLVDMPAWLGGLGRLRKLDLAYNSLTAYDIALLQYRLPRCEVTH